MSYMALYRKFRPGVFSEVKGQDAIVTTLRNQIKTERIGHAYLFCGTRGTGKTTVAKILAKAVNCEQPVDGEPCGECRICRGIANGSILNVVEIDAASNSGVENVRQIVEEVEYSPAEGKYKVYILDEVHMLTTAAFNALLKTLEEPPSYVIFILATTEAHRLPITILSRCQRYDFKRISIETIVDRLKELIEKEGASAEDEALRFIAKEADGSMRDALSLLDQCLAFHYGETLTYDKALDVLQAVDDGVFVSAMNCLGNKDINGALGIVEDISVQGRDYTQFVGDFLWYLRNLLLIKKSPDISAEVLEMSKESLARSREVAARFDEEDFIYYINKLSDLSAAMRYSDQKRILLEVAFIRMLEPRMGLSEENLSARIRELEKIVKGTGVIPLGFVPQGADGGMTGGGPGPGAAPAARRVLPKREKALPEDVKKVLSSWKAIKETIEHPLVDYLDKCRLSINDEDELLLVPLDSLTEKYLQQDGRKEAIMEAINESVEKEVTVKIMSATSEEEFAYNYNDLIKEFGSLVVKDETI